MAEREACLLVHNSKSHSSTFEQRERHHLPSHVHIFSKDVKIFIPGVICNPSPEKRKSVSLFSNSSCRNLLFVCRNSGENIKSQFALTYHNNFPVDGKETKKHLNTFLTNLRKKYPGIKYLWVLEFQKREAPHFHVFTDRLPSDVDFQEFCAMHWQKIVDPGNEDVLKVHLNKKNFIAWDMSSGKYLAKQYLSKANQKDVPENYHNVGRFWGNSKNMKPVPVVLDPQTLSAFILTYAIRNTAKRREKILSKFAGRKIKLRGKHHSFSLPLMSGLFITLLEHYGAWGPRAEQVLF